MKNFQTSIAFLVGLILASAGFPFALYGQDHPTGIPQIDEAFHQMGHNIIEHKTFDLGDEPLVLPQTFYPGNRYVMAVFQYADEGEPITLSLVSPEGEVRRQGSNELKLNRTLDFPKLEHNLRVEGPRDGKTRKIVLVSGYQSFTNTSLDHTQNRELRSFHTLNGMEEVNAWKEKVEQGYAQDLQQRLDAEGYSVIQTKVMATTSEDRQLEVDLLEGNKYVVFALSPPQAFVPFQLVRPGGPVESIFGTLPEDTEEEVLSEEPGQTMINRTSTILERAARLIRPQFTATMPNDEVVVVVAYKSRDNENGSAEKNLPEDHYID